MRRSPTHVILTILMDALVALAVVMTVGMVAAFFGAFQTTSVGEWLARFASSLTVPLDLPEWNTPYGGVFSSATAVTVGIVLGIEWFFSIARRRSAKD